MQKNNILTVKNLNKFQTLVSMYKNHKKLLPKNFNDYFKHTDTKYNLRSKQKGFLKIPKKNNKYIEHSLKYRGPKLWNDLPNDIKEAKSLGEFKKILKTILVCSYND